MVNSAPGSHYGGISLFAAMVQWLEATPLFQIGTRWHQACPEAIFEGNRKDQLAGDGQNTLAQTNCHCSSFRLQPSADHYIPLRPFLGRLHEPLAHHPNNGFDLTKCPGLRLLAVIREFRQMCEPLCLGFSLYRVKARCGEQRR